jgi:hypothetical protein
MWIEYGCEKCQPRSGVVHGRIHGVYVEEEGSMSMTGGKDDAGKVFYAETHPIVRLRTFRFEHSPYIEKY